MGYGGFNTGGGASSYDLDRLAASIINGHVSAPLTTADDVQIATRGGEGIAAFYSRAEEMREIYAAISALAADIIRGRVSTPMGTAAGIGVVTDGGTDIAAIKNL